MSELSAGWLGACRTRFALQSIELLLAVGSRLRGHGEIRADVAREPATPNDRSMPNRSPGIDVALDDQADARGLPHA